MPREAFADMWATLKGGEPWTALVKNRRKNGDHYWVRANATPVVRGGRQVGYMSVRTKPSREEVAAAEKLYQQMRDGQAGHVKLHKGLLLRTGLLGWTSRLQTMPVRWRIRSALFILPPTLIGAAGFLGLQGMAWAGFGATVMLATLLVKWILQSQIARPLEQVQAQALRVATGASQAAASMDRVDEIGMTLRAISQLGLMFRWLIDDVSQQVMTVQKASREIAQGNRDLSSRTEQAAASVEETASSMEQITATVKNNADTAQQANQLATSASEAALRGGKAVQQVVDRKSVV